MISIPQILLLSLCYWITPKRVIRRLLDMSLAWYVPLIPVLLSGVTFTIAQVSYRDLGDYFEFGSLLLASFGIGIGVGPLLWLLFSGLFYGVGKVFKGQASWRDMQIAVAFSLIPYVFKLLLWMVQLLLFGDEMFTDFTPRIDDSFFLTLFYLFFLLIQVILTIWYVVLLFFAVGEAHRFSTWIGLPVTLISVGLIWIVSKYVFDIVLYPA
ncbi:YIP1 family protein [Salinithrix halophila]|uniref:YIP1 family protein n=1 Tax=Salinithrix halophila TaxID=1485204 RepID=A0ABV8JE46_9BACL